VPGGAFQLRRGRARPPPRGAGADTRHSASTSLVNRSGFHGPSVGGDQLQFELCCRPILSFIGFSNHALAAGTCVATNTLIIYVWSHAPPRMAPIRRIRAIGSRVNARRGFKWARRPPARPNTSRPCSAGGIWAVISEPGGRQPPPRPTHDAGAERDAVDLMRCGREGRGAGPQGGRSCKRRFPPAGRRAAGR